MQEDEITKIQVLSEGKWMLSSRDPYVIEQYRILCDSIGKTELEKLGIFDTRRRVEEILGRIRERPILWGQDPKNQFLKKYGW